jgi:adenylate kinase family enzyme
MSKIILGGTSSSGKTTVSKLFPKKYYRIGIDDVWQNNGQICWKDVKNRFYIEKNKHKILDDCAYKLMVKKTKGHKNYVIDTIIFEGDPKRLLKLLPKSVKYVLIYTDLSHLVRNMVSRKYKEHRGLFVFNQFAKIYTKTNKKSEAVDKISLKMFIKKLHKIKYEFENEFELKKFARKIFSRMGIKDSKPHWIKTRYTGFDLILKTKGKTPKKLKNEILKHLKIE